MPLYYWSYGGIYRIDLHIYGNLTLTNDLIEAPIATVMLAEWQEGD